MAKQKLVTLIDDLDGSEAQATVQFGVGSDLWEIELNEAHQRELFGALSKFIAAATPLGAYQLQGSPRTGPRERSPIAKGRNKSRFGPAVRSGDVRAWAAEAGVYVHPRGRVPGSVVEQFEQARAAHAQ